MRILGSHNSEKVDKAGAISQLIDMQRLTGQDDFFVSRTELCVLAQFLCQKKKEVYLIFNRRHMGPQKYIHRIYWGKLRLIAVSNNLISLV